MEAKKKNQSGMLGSMTGRALGRLYETRRTGGAPE
jgi:hypothetical protein